MTMFSDGIQDPEYDYTKKLTPEELEGKTCERCYRCETRAAGGFPEKSGYHCTMQPFDHDIHPEDKACEYYWDRREFEEYEKERDRRTEARRKELWEKYQNKPPIKIRFVFDGYGRIPECPVCEEMPYSLQQCHWCGQHFIQDKETKEYDTPKTEQGRCPNCGKPITIMISNYNGHKSGHCDRWFPRMRG